MRIAKSSSMRQVSSLSRTGQATVSWCSDPDEHVTLFVAGHFDQPPRIADWAGSPEKSSTMHETEICFFASPAEFRAWLKRNHQAVPALTIGFHRKDSGRGGITYAEALDEALCFGWIDGVRRKVDETRFSIRFTRRKPGSIWSLINVGHAERLRAAGRVTASGIAAFAARQAHKTGIYSFEQKQHSLVPVHEKTFRANKKAWAFWEAQPPGYRRVSMHWVTSAKQEATRLRRLTQLIADSAAGVRLGVVTGKKRDA
ncbi:MAG: YdeI/OmpD-associated family protein [Betaproteobacteria bacterium]